VNAANFREGHGTSRGCTSSVERRILTRASLHPTYGGNNHPAYEKESSGVQLLIQGVVYSWTTLALALSGLGMWLMNRSELGW